MKARASPLTGLGFVLGSVLLVSISQLFLRIGALSLPVEITPAFVVSVLEHPGWARLAVTLGIGVFCYLGSFGLWLVALRSVPLNIAYPLLSLSYPLVYLAAVSLPGFDEHSDPMQWLGIGLIILGVGFVTASHRSETRVPGSAD